MLQQYFFNQPIVYIYKITYIMVLEALFLLKEPLKSL